MLEIIQTSDGKEYGASGPPKGTGAPSLPENERGNKLKKDPNLPPLNGLKTKTDPARVIFYLFIFY